MASRTINAVGVCFYAVKTKRYLYLLRNDPKHPSTWGLPGGRFEPGETLIDAMTRECVEEMGFMPTYSKLVPLEQFTTSDSAFVYNTFYCVVEDEFCPVLNDEHIGWAWIASGHWPKPMHPGLWSTVNMDAVQHKIKTMEQSSI